MQQTQAERDAIARTLAKQSAAHAGVRWPLLDATLDEPEGDRMQVLVGCALVDVVVESDDGVPYVAAVNLGGAWVDACSFGDAFCKTLDAALTAAIAIRRWSGE